MPEAAGADSRDPSMAEILASIQRILSENDPEDRSVKPTLEAPRLAPVSEPIAAEAPLALMEKVPEPVAKPAEDHATVPEADADSEDVLVLDRSMMVSEGAVEPAYKSSLLEAATSRDLPPMSTADAGGSLIPHPFPLPEEEPVEPPPPAAAEAVEPPPPVREPVTMPAMPVAYQPPIIEPEGLVAPDAAALAKSSINNLVRTLAAERVVPVQRGGLTIEDLVREELRPLLKTWLDRHLPPLVEKLVQVEIERVVNRATS
jgi:cell pole-organizing protein PopZ